MNETILTSYPAMKETEFMLRLALRERFDRIPEELDQEKFDETMKKHRIYPLVIRGLRQFTPEQLEGFPVLAKYRALQNRYAGGSLKRMQTLALVAKAMEEARIPMISMKGPLLSVELYGDPAMRHSHDLDVLVREEDFLRSAACLKELGFEQAENPHLKTPKRMEVNLRYTTDNHGEFRRGDQCVELHWRSSTEVNVPFDALWENREEKLLLGVKVNEMGRDHKLPHLFAHAAHHGFARLRWLLDLYEVQRKPGFSWDELLESMRQQGNSPLLFETLIVLMRWRVIPMETVTIGSVSVRREDDRVIVRYGDDCKTEVEQAVALSDAAWPMMERELDWTFPEFRAHEQLLPHAAVRHSLWHRIISKFQPGAVDFELIDLPDRWFWLYYLIRPVYLFWRKLTGGKK
ncbi:MAG: hypothetical protein E7451_01820 [Ruminococcaceae bacterium]|nr:hypothetical protein [Oscillospiraceae bacterium]